jgi:DNA-binding response OmpR family regulator
MRSLLRRGKADPVLLEVENLQLDPVAQVVRRDGREIDLSAREYALLEFMMRNPRHILSKQQILDHVWGNEVDPFSNVVDVYIGYLRNKVDKPYLAQGGALITTVKGLGYRIGGSAK